MNVSSPIVTWQLPQIRADDMMRHERETWYPAERYRNAFMDSSGLLGAVP
jgi:hypothetical protein